MPSIRHLTALSSAYFAGGNSLKGNFIGCRRPMLAFQHIHLQSSAHITDTNRISPNHLFSTGSTDARTETTSDVDKLLEPAPFKWQELVALFRPTNKNTHFIPSNHPKLEMFRRSSAIQSTYLQHQKGLKRQWKSAYDYLCINKFGEDFGFKPAPVKEDINSDYIIEHKIREAQYESNPSLKEASVYTIKNKLRYLSLVPNDFPYDVDNEIKHYCLWKIGGTSVSEGILQDEMKWAITELTKCTEDSFIGSCLIVNNDSVEHYATKHSEISNHNHGIVDYFYWVNPPHLQSMPEIQHAHILVLRSDKYDQTILGSLDNSLSTFRSKL